MDGTRPWVRPQAVPRYVLKYVPTTLYHHDGVTVTSNSFCVDGHRYPIRELSHVYRVYPPHEPDRFHALITSVLLLGVLLAPALVAGGAGAAAWFGAGATGALAARLIRIRLRPRVAELWGRFRGRPVRLLTTTDQTHFGQVCRALQRARELADRTRLD